MRVIKLRKCFGDAYIHLSDFESNSGYYEDMKKTFEKDGEWNFNFITTDLSYYVDEPPKPSFDHVSI